MLILVIHESVKIPNLFAHQQATYVVTGNLKIFPHSRNRNIVSKGPKYIFPSHIDFNRRIKEIASTLNAFGNRLCKRECHSKCDCQHFSSFNCFRKLNICVVYMYL